MRSFPLHKIVPDESGTVKKELARALPKVGARTVTL